MMNTNTTIASIGSHVPLSISVVVTWLDGDLFFLAGSIWGFVAIQAVHKTLQVLVICWTLQYTNATYTVILKLYAWIGESNELINIQQQFITTVPVSHF